AVIGLPNEKWGEVGAACVVLKPNTAVSADELMHLMQDNLARYKVPKQIIFMKELPISGAGKILKRVLKLNLTKG
ncbi:MAG: long-chain fatty acid--CoA ligase, partial [Chloroflexi bacterium]|nr:long-chain fatty acid--CoA ligase [Chloroflexota bacterium]